jgi:GrpB-like predicted nucleotidyltransferase (UPF0157 family)
VRSKDGPEPNVEVQLVTDQRPGRNRIPMTDAEVRASWTTEPPRLDGQITLLEYDPAWPGLFQRESERIHRVLGTAVLGLEHTGSTSVPGLAAKPIIDMLLLVADSSLEPAYVPALEAAGYRLVIREPDWHEHRVFKGPDTNVNLHVLTIADPEVDRVIGFRDWLRTHDEDRAWYEGTKRDLAAQTWTYVQNYADAKTQVVEVIIERAAKARDSTTR